MSYRVVNVVVQGDSIWCCQAIVIHKANLDGVEGAIQEVGRKGVGVDVFIAKRGRTSRKQNLRETTRILRTLWS